MLKQRTLNKLKTTDYTSKGYVIHAQLKIVNTILKEQMPLCHSARTQTHLYIYMPMIYSR